MICKSYKNLIAGFAGQENIQLRYSVWHTVFIILELEVKSVFEALIFYEYYSDVAPDAENDQNRGDEHQLLVMLVFHCVYFDSPLESAICATVLHHIFQ